MNFKIIYKSLTSAPYCLFLASSHLLAADSTWTGGAGTTAWGTATNWHLQLDSLSKQQAST